MQEGYIYALQNKSFGEHHIKIGKTTVRPESRAKQLSAGSGVPEYFDVAFTCQVTDCNKAEIKIHERLKAYRTNQKREFFLIPIEVASKVIIGVCKEVNEIYGLTVQYPQIIESQSSDKANLELEDSVETTPEDGCWIQSDRIVLFPADTSILTEEQKQRIKIIADITANHMLRTLTLDEWIVGFTRDEHPEEEIFIWESIIKAYLKIDQVKYLDKDQKKESLSLLLMRSTCSASQVLKNFKLDRLSRKVAKEILRNYEDPPKSLLIAEVTHYFCKKEANGRLTVIWPELTPPLECYLK
jgi:hypothetical protein